MNFNLDKILSEWAYRVDDGQPSVSNPDHLENLREILYNFGLPHKFIVEYVHGLTEADKVYFVGKPPKGAKVQQGPRGGTYYYGNSKSGKPEPVTINPAPEKDKADANQPHPKMISGKNKALEQGNPSETKEFNKDLDSQGAEAFAIKNQDNSIPPPYKLPESILKNPKFPKKYLTAIERMMNTQANNKTSSWKYFSDQPGGAGKISAQSGELLTMMGCTMSESEFQAFATSLEQHEKAQIERNPTLKKEGSRIITKSWIAAARKSRKVILDRVEKMYGKGAVIIGSCWDTKNDVEAMGLSDYKKNKGFSTDIYLKIKKSDGEEILNEISLKKDGNINFLNSGLGDMVNNWDPKLKGTSLDPTQYAINERSRLVTGAENILSKEIQQKLKDELNSTKSGKGNRAKSKIILQAIKQEAVNGNESAKKYLENDDITHRKMQEDAITQLNTNPVVKEGLLRTIKQEFPLKAVSTGEETMAIGDMSLDKETMQTVFGTDDFDKLKDNFSVKKNEKNEPYLEYNIKGGETIKIANIVIRQDGRGYGGGSFKFEMRLHPELAKKLKAATQYVYKKL